MLPAFRLEDVIGATLSWELVTKLDDVLLEDAESNQMIPASGDASSQDVRSYQKPLGQGS